MPQLAKTRDTRLSLAHVWRRADGQLVLLDFPWPAPGRAGRQSALSILSSCWRPSPRAHLLRPAEPAAPLSGTTLLNRLASGAPPALADVKAELLRLASIPSRPSRVRRALPMVMAAMPVAALVLIVSVMLPMFARSLQGDAGNMFRQRNDFMRWMTWLTDSGADAEFKTREQRDRGGAVCCCAFWLAAHERRVLEHSDASDRTVSRL